MLFTSFFHRKNKTFSNHPFPLLKTKKIAIQKLLSQTPDPLFLGDKNILCNKYDQLSSYIKQSWPKTSIAYSFKTNYEVAKTKIFQDRGAWAEVVSGKEYSLAKKLGYSGKKIIFNGPFKTDLQLKTALNDDALIHIDNQSELNSLFKISGLKNQKFRVGIRVNPSIKEIGRSRFGFSIESGEAQNAALKIASSGRFHLISIHAHIGSDVDNPKAFRKSASKVAKLTQDLQSKLQINSIKYLDFGGGFPGHGLKPFNKDHWHPQPIKIYINAITRSLHSFIRQNPPTLIVEPGRYLVDDAIIFVTKIINQKLIQNQQIILTNGALTMLPLKHYRPQIVTVFQPDLVKQRGSFQLSTVHGATCREDDILYEGYLPISKPNDYIIYFCTGAYNQSMSSSFIFNIPKLILI